MFAFAEIQDGRAVSFYALPNTPDGGFLTFHSLREATKGLKELAKKGWLRANFQVVFFNRDESIWQPV